MLISAGIGITPIIGMLHYLTGVGSTREVLVLHADRSPARHAHRQELKELVAGLPHATLHRWYEDLGVRPTRDVLRAGRVRARRGRGPARRGGLPVRPAAVHGVRAQHA